MHEAEADAFHAHLGDLCPALDVWLAVDEAGCAGAIAPVDSRPTALESLMAQLRKEPRVHPLTVAVGHFPSL